MAGESPAHWGLDRCLVVFRLRCSKLASPTQDGGRRLAVRGYIAFTDCAGSLTHEFPVSASFCCQPCPYCSPWLAAVWVTPSLTHVMFC